MRYIMNVFDWIAKLAYLNILWILFSIFGGIILGFFPSTVTMYIIIRKWKLDRSFEIRFQEYFRIFKKEFFPSNKLGLYFVIIIFLLYVNTQYMYYYDYGFHKVIKIPLIFTMIIIALTLLYAIPVYVHFHLSTRKIFKYSLLLMITHPLYNIGMLICIAILLLVTLFLPNTLLFFFGSVTSYIIMSTCLFIFRSVSSKQKNYILK